MGWVGLPKTIHCNETKRTHSMRYLLLCAIISWPAVGGLCRRDPAVGSVLRREGKSLQPGARSGSQLMRVMRAAFHRSWAWLSNPGPAFQSRFLVSNRNSVVGQSRTRFEIAPGTAVWGCISRQPDLL